MSTPPARRSTARLLLLGCAGLVAFCIAAFVVLVVVRAMRLGGTEGGGADARERESPAAMSSPLTGGYRGPAGCFAFDPGREWQLVEETGLRAAFSADPDNPLRRQPDRGSSGLWVEATCAPLDKVGPDWPLPVPGVSHLENRRVEFGGGRGRLRVIRLASRGVSPILQIGFAVDRNGGRCGFSVEGSPQVVERFRPEFERAAASFVCAGR
ncbi:MAG: hypothetical protein ACRD2Z_12940 [Thermoanaerobaculia bacterium]